MDIREKGELKKIPLNQLELWREVNVRKSDVYREIEDLANNIRSIGLQVPLVVKEAEPDKKYLVISGQRRLQACRLVNYDPVPCIVIKKIDIDEAKLASLSENLYRREMNDDDISDACDYLYKHYKNLSLVAKHLGVSEAKVRKYLGYKNVAEEIKELVRAKKLSSGQAILIYTQFPDVKKAIRVARELASIKERAKRTKFVQALKESTSTDDVPQIRERARRLAGMKQYVIILPPRTSIAIERVAKERSLEPEEILAEIIEYWVEERLKGGLSIIA